MSEYFKNPASITAIVWIASAHFFLIDNRQEEIGRDEKQGSLEPGWRYADDCVWMLVDLNGAAHCGSITLETGVPIRVCEHDVGHAVRPVLIGGMEESAEIRMNAQHVEVVSRRCKAVRRKHILACIQAHAEGEIKGRKLFKAAVAIAQIQIVWIRLPCGVVAVLRSVQGLRLRDIERAQDQSIHQAKDDGIGANR